MLSRTAENLYWLARYVERAEYIARTIDATLRVTALPAAYIGKTNEWESALLTAGVSASFYEVYQEANEQNVVEYLAFSPSNPSSIKNCIEAARLNSRSVRTALTSEMWDTINSAWIELREALGQRHLQPRGTGEIPALRAGDLAAVRRFRLPDHAAQRRLLVLAARPASGARRQHRPHSRREVSRAAARGGTCRRPAGLLPVDLDPALGVGADRLSLGLSRDAENPG